jgi:uncharacterized protein with NRDE domain
MCIALFSTTHPQYSLVILSNRDEFLNRPTAPADWWKAPHDHVIGGRDLQRSAQGTWLGLTKDGRVALLTNFCDECQETIRDKSRGAIVNAYLDSPPSWKESDDEFAKRLVEEIGIKDLGGFSLVFGDLQPTTDGSSRGLSIISNRTTNPSSLVRIVTSSDDVCGLSNSHFGDLSWPKIVYGKQLLRHVINISVTRQDSQDRFVDSLFDVLSFDTFPKLPKGQKFDVYAREMRNSIFIPRIEIKGMEWASTDRPKLANTECDGYGVGAGFEAGVACSYGTQKQTVVLVDRSGKITFIERSLYDQDAQATKSERKFEYQISP